jgi:hypothetical protein
VATFSLFPVLKDQRVEAETIRAPGGLIIVVVVVGGGVPLTRCFCWRLARIKAPPRPSCLPTPIVSAELELSFDSPFRKD